MGKCLEGHNWKHIFGKYGVWHGYWILTTKVFLIRDKYTILVYYTFHRNYLQVVCIYKMLSNYNAPPIFSTIHIANRTFHPTRRSVRLKSSLEIPSASSCNDFVSSPILSFNP